MSVISYIFSVECVLYQTFIVHIIVLYISSIHSKYMCAIYTY